MMNDKVAVPLPFLLLWKRVTVTLGCICLLLLALMVYPPAYESARMLLSRPISSAIASNASDLISPAAARRQQITSARAVVHGSFLKDPYGCIYMVEYIGAKLSLSPLLDEQRQPVCTGH